jgi:hypothetical protein
MNMVWHTIDSKNATPVLIDLVDYVSMDSPFDFLCDPQLAIPGSPDQM